MSALIKRIWKEIKEAEIALIFYIYFFFLPINANDMNDT